jgi:hypothetical protein
MSTDLRNQFNNYMTVQRFSPHTKRINLQTNSQTTKYRSIFGTFLKTAGSPGVPATTIFQVLCASTKISANGMKPNLKFLHDHALSSYP